MPSRDIDVEMSPNGILGRILSKDIIVYPGVFLGLPFDVTMPRGVPVFGPDVPPPNADQFDIVFFDPPVPEEESR